MVARGLKICSTVSTLFLIIVAIVIVTLVLTIFKMKDPIINVHPVGLQKFQLSFSSNSTSNVTLGIVMSVVNPNYGGFEYKNSSAYVKFHDTIVAEVPIEADLIHARSKINMTASAGFMTGKLISDPNFWTDVITGSLNLTSTASLTGKVIILKIFKLKAMVYNSCDISVNISSQAADSTCMSKIKL